MARAPKRPPPVADLPVLTEVPESDADLPVLTEALAEEMPPAPPLKSKVKTRSDDFGLTDAQYRQIAEYIAPQLEAVLRKKVAARMNALWPELWKEVQEELPDMIRDVIIESGRRTRK
jgi:hypothetical protein